MNKQAANQITEEEQIELDNQEWADEHFRAEEEANKEWAAYQEECFFD